MLKPVEYIIAAGDHGTDQARRLRQTKRDGGDGPAVCRIPILILLDFTDRREKVRH